MSQPNYINRKGEHCRHGFIGTCPLSDECNVTSEILTLIARARQAQQYYQQKHDVQLELFNQEGKP